MIKLSVYDWSCADLIHSYVGDHFNDFCDVLQTRDYSELEYVLLRFSDFRDYANFYGYDVTR